MPVPPSFLPPAARNLKTQSPEFLGEESSHPAPAHNQFHHPSKRSRNRISGSICTCGARDRIYEECREA